MDFLTHSEAITQELALSPSTACESYNLQQSSILQITASVAEDAQNNELLLGRMKIRVCVIYCDWVPVFQKAIPEKGRRKRGTEPQANLVYWLIFRARTGWMSERQTKKE